MAKFIDDRLQDFGLDHLKDNVTLYVLCDGQPLDFSDATTDLGLGGNALGEILVGPTDVVIGAGDVSGRKATVGAQANIPVDVTGDLDHIALVDETNSVLLAVTTVSNAQTITQGNNVDMAAFDVEIEDPA